MSAIGRGGGVISVIVELQQEALDRNTSVSDLLRKALLISQKLRLSEFQVWIEKELSGFKDEVPEHRLDEVRNAIMRWALKLEDEGIYGDGLSFTLEEQRAAERIPQTITDYYFKSAESVRLVALQLVPVKVSAADLEDLRAFLADLKAEMGSLGLDEEHLAEVATEVSILETLLKSPRLSATVIRESLSIIRRILEGAAGRGAAQLLVQLGEVAFGR